MNTKLGLKAGRPSVQKAVIADKKILKRINFDLDEEQAIKLKIHAAKQGRSISDILRELVESLPE